MAKTVVVLGGSLGGLAVTHRLLKYTLPQDKDLRVVLVSKMRELAVVPRPAARPPASHRPVGPSPTATGLITRAWATVASAPPAVTHILGGDE
ncbi:hypothetical protein CDD83_10894 [Cordyceps sp. RAO-2017]|nr:hypothetical protein CDD83_10894 [Cordyceps sp. RAO-2017]